MNTFSRHFAPYRKLLSDHEAWLKVLWKGTIIGFLAVLGGIVVFSWYQYIWVTSEVAAPSNGKTIRTGITMVELDAIKMEHENQKKMFEEASLFEEKAPVLK